MSCIDCGRKGHAASECQQPKKEKGSGPGREALFAITAKDSDNFTKVGRKPRSREVQLGDFIANDDKRQRRPTDNNKHSIKRFRPLALQDGSESWLAPLHLRCRRCWSSCRLPPQLLRSQIADRPGGGDVDAWASIGRHSDSAGFAICLIRFVNLASC